MLCACVSNYIDTSGSWTNITFFFYPKSQGGRGTHGVQPNSSLLFNIFMHRDLHRCIVFFIIPIQTYTQILPHIAQHAIVETSLISEYRQKVTIVLFWCLALRSQSRDGWEFCSVWVWFLLFACFPFHNFPQFFYFVWLFCSVPEFWKEQNRFNYSGTGIQFLNSFWWLHAAFRIRSHIMCWELWAHVIYKCLGNRMKEQVGFLTHHSFMLCFFLKSFSQVRR